MPARRRRTGPPLTVEAIRDAALAIVRERGYDAVSMRAVAQRLDTGQASLYAHVRGKNDLDRLLMEHVFAQLPLVEGGDWRDHLTSFYANLRRQMAEHSGLSHAYFGSNPTDPASTRRLEDSAAALERAGFTPRQGLVAGQAIDLVAAAEALAVDTMTARVAAAGVGYTEHVREQLDEALALWDDFPAMRRQLDALRGLRVRDLTPEIVQIVLTGLEEHYQPQARVAVEAEDAVFLELAVTEAESAAAAGEEPYGAVLAGAEGAVLARAYNRGRASGDPTDHAELTLARWAADRLSSAERAAATVHCSTEPCPMCAGALGWTGLGRVVFAVSGAEMAAWGREAGRPEPAVTLLRARRILRDAAVVGPADVPALRDRVRALVVPAP